MYSVHPAIRDGFLKSLDADAAKRGHDAARKGLQAVLGERPGERYPSDPATLDLLEEIVYHTLAAGHAQDAFDIYWDRIGGSRNLLWRLGAYERGERICRAFAAGRPPEEAPLSEGLSENDQALFINEWAMYLWGLGRLDAAARCFERNIEMRMRQEGWQNASPGNLNLAAVLLPAGHLAAGLRAAEEGLHLAKRADQALGRFHSYAFRGHARALHGETQAALADFDDAFHWQHKGEGETDRPLYSNRGVFQALLLAHLGRNEEATRLTEANDSVAAEVTGTAQHMNFSHCRLLLANLARERGEIGEARDLLGQAHDWALARDAKEVLCWSALVRARIALAEARQQADFPHGEQAARFLDEARDSIERGLRIARDCGFGIYHIDLLLERAQLNLHLGKADGAERDVRVALDEGHKPPAESGLPTLLAAADPECGYA